MKARIRAKRLAQEKRNVKLAKKRKGKRIARQLAQMKAELAAEQEMHENFDPEYEEDEGDV